MASEAQNVRKQNLLCLEDHHPVDLPRKRSSRFINENMKEGKKSAKHLASCTSRTVGQTVTSPHPLFRAVYCKRKVLYYSPKPCFKKKQLPKVKGRDMANKENELACAGNLPAKLPADGRTFLLNSSESGRSQAESPSSKYSGFFSEVSEDHDTMAQVLFSRNLRLNVALTFWRRRSISELVAYLVRIQDLGVVVDCLPVLTSSLQEEKPYISVGCCVDLLPLVKLLLKSKFEEYVIVGLNWLQAVIKRWWSELSAHTEKIEDGNIQILKEQLSGLWKQENHLTLVPGYTGNIAKDVDTYLLQLH
ncbi:KATNB1-like protein 1 [Eublepharis macularius]|uniref:KATNB1-like protein 1 n=1 Tax=Eublepharis macularius TaxID=481883 RepID=A0AA97KSK7_EUBMA|nr:KATNB1-like protein 1 [Eublepharis macularius]XP_054828062.1 KATNB1-like protein 1 [Eublepharis macularius]